MKTVVTITIVLTHTGLERFCKLNFGETSIIEIFHEEREKF